MAASDEHPQLPQPPRMERRLRLTGYQLVGFSLLALLALLALFGAFGVRKHTATAAGELVELSVRHSTVSRFGISDDVRFAVRNLSGAELNEVELRVSNDYLSGFGSLAFTPGATHIDDGWHVASLGPIAPDEQRELIIEFTTASRGVRTGEVAVFLEGGEELRQEFSTLLLP